MAVMIPATPQNFNNSEGEYQVFHALKQLDNRCYVFYSLRWINRLYRSNYAELVLRCQQIKQRS